MKNLLSLMIVLFIATFIFTGCSKDNSTNPNQDFNNLNIPDGFNWTNLDHIQLNISLDDATIIAKNAVIVSHGEKVLAKKFLQNGRLEMNINSIKGNHNLLVEVPAYGFSHEIATNVKVHNLVVTTAGKRKSPDITSKDPNFKEEIEDDDDYYYNEFLDGKKNSNTGDLADCPANSYLTTTYVFLDAGMNYIDLNTKNPGLTETPWEN